MYVLPVVCSVIYSYEWVSMTMLDLLCDGGVLLHTAVWVIHVFMHDPGFIFPCNRDCEAFAFELGLKWYAHCPWLWFSSGMHYL